MGKIYSVLLGLLLIGSSLFGQTTIVTDTVIPTSTCPGAFMLVPFTVTNPNFNPGNRFYAEWSNAFGSFADPDTIGSVPFIFGSQGVIITNIPNDAGFGLLYRVRVVASDPEVVGSQCPLPIFVTAINFTANISADPSDEQCTGEDVTLTAGLGLGTGSYAWSTGDTTPTITVNQPGNYVVTVTSLGCEVASDPFTLNMLPQPAQPEIEALPSGHLQTNPHNSLQWYLNEFPLPATNTHLYQPTQTGYYSVIVTDTNGCQSLPSVPVFHAFNSGTTVASQFEPYRDTIINWLPETINPDTSTVDTTTPPDPTYTDVSIKIYPNPTQDILRIETNTLWKEKIYFTLYDAHGRKMHESPREWIDGYYYREVDMSTFPAGIYNMHLFIWGYLRTVNIYKQ